MLAVPGILEPVAGALMDFFDLPGYGEGNPEAYQPLGHTGSDIGGRYAMSEPLKGKKARNAVMVVWTILAILLAILGTTLFISFVQAIF